ncbi:stonustoxin subunit beta-like isoform X1 [Triplophysa dalaica]|uniref:stonustoxin subunit beta-like isoform X1 n=1 Tax=Triplophysa dalaica TaxID=1582913 RepID=UPI0024E02807|nr:stonustoxin subunit beta-like isoform X1 [Triplophysa dalaica]
MVSMYIILTNMFVSQIKCTEIISSPEPKTRDQFLQYSLQLTLDPNTLYKHLHLSERNRVIQFSRTDQRYPDHPDRFDCCQVLCKESVSQRSYWEIKWTGGVDISVAYKSIGRKELGHVCHFGRNDKSWRLYCSESRFSFSHNDKWINLPVVSSSDRIGVYVDERAGTLSFYSVSDTNMTLILSINTIFTQPLYPGFAIVSIHSKVTLCDLRM